MALPQNTKPNFAAVPSPPRAGHLARTLVYVLLLLIACAAIWWIDRGAMLSNGGAHPGPASRNAEK